MCLSYAMAAVDEARFVSLVGQLCVLKRRAIIESVDDIIYDAVRLMQFDLFCRRV